MTTRTTCSGVIRASVCCQVSVLMMCGCSIISRGHIAQRALHLLVHSTLTVVR
jgi:hypothetical protein